MKFNNNKNVKFNKYLLQVYSYPTLSCELRGGTEDSTVSHSSRMALKTQALKYFAE